MRPIQILFISSVLFAMLIAASASIRAAESYDNCTGFIDSVPATITTQGTWCLRQDLTTGIATGNAINIDVNNVTIDCNDFKIGGLSAGTSTTAIGIRLNSRLNATVRNCNIRGFAWGLHFTGQGAGGHIIEDNRFDGNTLMGIYLDGDGSVIRRNLVFATGGSTSGATYAYGISAALDVDIIDNTVAGVLPTPDSSGFAYANGIRIGENPSGSIGNNRVRGVFSFGSGVAWGIYTYFSDRISLVGNHVIGDGSSGSIGLQCHLASNARAKDNIVNGFATPIKNCRDDGNSL